MQFAIEYLERTERSRLPIVIYGCTLGRVRKDEGQVKVRLDVKNLLKTIQASQS